MPGSRRSTTRRPTGLPAVADDSGLEIAALDNAPGVHSARWNGRDYAVKFAAIYRELQARGTSRQRGPIRGAHRAGACRSDPLRGDRHHRGRDRAGAAGRAWLRLRPDLLLPALRPTLAEVTGERKAAVSHRGKAFRALREHLMKDPAVLAG